MTIASRKWALVYKEDFVDIISDVKAIHSKFYGFEEITKNDYTISDHFIDINHILTHLVDNNENSLYIWHTLNEIGKTLDVVTPEISQIRLKEQLLEIKKNVQNLQKQEFLYTDPPYFFNSPKYSSLIELMYKKKLVLINGEYFESLYKFIIKIDEIVAKDSKCGSAKCKTDLQEKNESVYLNIEKILNEIKKSDTDIVNLTSEKIPIT